VEGPVKPNRQEARRAATESRIIKAASDLFIRLGYPATTLAAVADDAGVAPRTVYVRFDTKAELLNRCLDVAIAGDEDGVAVDNREWVREAMSGPTLIARVASMATATAALMERGGPLLRVAQEAETVEPTIAARAQAARFDTKRVLETFFQTMADDGLLPRSVDAGWLAATGAIVGQAETYVLISRTTDWDAAAYRKWLTTTWLRLASAADVD
jgi:AcrR family transcriptional regulator